MSENDVARFRIFKILGIFALLGVIVVAAGIVLGTFAEDPGDPEDEIQGV